jgi:coproporphyrinogen III oxidase-like Fe-S oxidoreductase
MAYLQPKSFSPDHSSSRRIRLTAIRGLMPKPERTSGHRVKEVWERRFSEQGRAHPYWLYTHIPFCPQICSFCQCSTSLRKSDNQVAAYLEWLEGELDFFAATAEKGVAAFQYIGGGTPNILTDAQLERLLGRINQAVRFAPDSRRCFEFLPSSLRESTLPLVRSLGFNRLTCGVQSWSAETLKAVNRSQAGLDQLGRTIESAYALGFDEFNVDLIFGIGDETRERFLDGLIEVLALRPTTVTLHNVIPTATNPVFSTVEQELAAHDAFEALQDTLGAAVARAHPNIDWVLRPNSWILVDRRFRQSPAFSLWYYSDNERIHIDMLSLGRFAHSNIPGRVTYENLSHADRYDPAEACYSAFWKTPTVDAAMDLITDLVGDRTSDLAPIARRYGADAVRALQPALERLQGSGVIVERNGRWESVATDGVFIDPVLPLLDATLQGGAAPWITPTSRDAERAVAISNGDHSLLVYVEKVDAQRRYFSQLGQLGVYYRDAGARPSADQSAWVEQVMHDVVQVVRALVERVPNTTAKEATARLRAWYQRSESRG